MFDQKDWILKLILGFSATFFVVIVVFTVFDFEPKSNIQVKIYEVDGGFGYLLNDNGKVLIKQGFIPGISGSHAFCSKEDAIKTAEKVRQKIINKESPTLTIHELKALDLRLNCLDL